ncbi:MAG: bifunctional DNA-binding transcriptional regulator/O6-methylguanine-DNA methyltransferase Ada [Planctomycetota bacterium]|nr:bifunctional DNA-binding transcriptional regulator/O6-methylguanine-DNA methyltransferase Ada [Planctomycetota bacterium]
MSPSKNAQRVTDLCRLIETSESEPSLDTLSKHVGLSTFYVQRIFKEVTGVTPKAYAKAHRAGRVRHALTEGGSVTEAMYDAGYQSSGRFYGESDRVLGMKPSQVRRGGKGTEIRFAVGECSLGSILVAGTSIGICAILIGDDAQGLVDDLCQRFSNAELVGGDAEFESWVAQVVGFVERPWTQFDLPLDIQGTAFQQRVWSALTAIPPGETRSYSELAQAIGAPKSARAVASACASNKLAVVIPCHRVVRTDGGLSGYRWGIDRKASLLTRESAHTAKGLGTTG